MLDVDLSAHADSPGLREMQAVHREYAVAYQPDYPTYPFHATARRTMIARARIEDGEITEVGFLPCLINRRGQPELLDPRSAAFDDVVRHIVEITATACFDVPMHRTGSGVVVDVAAGSPVDHPADHPADPAAAPHRVPTEGRAR